MRLSRLPIAMTCKWDLQENGLSVEEIINFGLVGGTFALYDPNNQHLGDFGYSFPGLDGWYVLLRENILAKTILERHKLYQRATVRDTKVEVASGV